jgi:isocitrate/isopropylmalate dehydrogenase
MLLTSALMLAELRHLDEARLLEEAVQKAVLDGKGTVDMGGQLSTRESTDEVLKNVRERLAAGRSSTAAAPNVRR